MVIIKAQFCSGLNGPNEQLEFSSMTPHQECEDDVKPVIVLEKT